MAALYDAAGLHCREATRASACPSDFLQVFVTALYGNSQIDPTTAYDTPFATAEATGKLCGLPIDCRQHAVGLRGLVSDENPFDDDSDACGTKGVVAMGGDGQVTVGSIDHEGRRHENPPPDRWQGDHRFRRRQRRRLRPAGTVRGQAEGFSGQRAAGRHRIGQGMADRSRAAAAGGAAGRRRRPAYAAADRQRRRDPADRRRAGHRLGRELCRGRGPGAGRPIRLCRPRRSSAQALEIAAGHRHLHEHQHRGGGTCRARADPSANRRRTGPAHRRPGRRPSGPWPWPSAIAGGGSNCRRKCGRRSRPRTS